jgi:DNA-binding NarL/FixJ family response regulator
MGAPAQEETPITCLLVDDHQAILDALHRLLEAEGIAVVGRARSGADALAFANASATVIVTDHTLPDMSGLELARAILAERPGQKIVLYTSRFSPRGVEDALAMGVKGIVLTDSIATDLPHAIRLVADGGTYVDPGLRG